MFAVEGEIPSLDSKVESVPVGDPLFLIDGSHQNMVAMYRQTVPERGANES